MYEQYRRVVRWFTSTSKPVLPAFVRQIVWSDVLHFLNKHDHNSLIIPYELMMSQPGRQIFAKGSRGARCDVYESTPHDSKSEKGRVVDRIVDALQSKIVPLGWRIYFNTTVDAFVITMLSNESLKFSVKWTELPPNIGVFRQTRVDLSKTA